jgi:hypothetical protein
MSISVIAGQRIEPNWLPEEASYAGCASASEPRVDVQQRADFRAKCGRQRATADAQKVRNINDLAIFGLLATDQKVRSSNLFGRAIYLSLFVSSWPTL